MSTKLLAVEYNVSPDGLGDITQDEYLDALENEFYLDPRNREATLRVTFNDGLSGVTRTEFMDEDDEVDEEQQQKFHDKVCELMNAIGEQAFKAVCEMD